jgi:hypothetical protein
MFSWLAFTLFIVDCPTQLVSAFTQRVGVGESHTLGGIAGAEVVYLPRLRQVAVYTWGGIEGEGTRDGSVRRLVLEF